MKVIILQFLKVYVDNLCFNCYFSPFNNTSKHVNNLYADNVLVMISEYHDKSFQNYLILC